MTYARLHLVSSASEARRHQRRKQRPGLGATRLQEQGAAVKTIKSAAELEADPQGMMMMMTEMVVEAAVALGLPTLLDQGSFHAGVSQRKSRPWQR